MLLAFEGISRPVEPIGADHAVDLLHAAFPDVARTQIEGDVAALVAELATRGLVIEP